MSSLVIRRKTPERGGYTGHTRQAFKSNRVETNFSYPSNLSFPFGQIFSLSRAYCSSVYTRIYVRWFFSPSLPILSFAPVLFFC